MEREERESIIQEAVNRAVEKALLTLPEVMGNLMVEHATHIKLNTQFYKDHPEFTNHKDVVASVVEMIDGKDTLAPYEKKLKDAIPEIRSRIALLGKMDMNSVNQPNRDFSDYSIDRSTISPNGVI